MRELLSGRVLDWRLRGFGLEPHRGHCVVSLSKTLILCIVSEIYFELESILEKNEVRIFQVLLYLVCRIALKLELQ